MEASFLFLARAFYGSFFFNAYHGITAAFIVFEEFEGLQEIRERENAVDSRLNGAGLEVLHDLGNILDMLFRIIFGPETPHAADGCGLLD